MRFEVIDHPGASQPALPAATVILARDGSSGIEVLLIHRGKQTAFGGMWAFPGGVVEDEDIPAGSLPDPLPATRRAAVREAHEEVGLRIDESSLVFWSHWLPPAMAPRRFSTWFYLAPGDDSHRDVGIDGHEVRDHRWMTPTDALAASARREIELAPPTFVTLAQLERHRKVADAVAAADSTHFATEFTKTSAGVPVCLFAGDRGYGSGEIDAPGPRHRLEMDDETGWRYLDSR